MLGPWDMHVHLRNGMDESGPDLASENAVWLRQYLGFGITAVRDAGLAPLEALQSATVNRRNGWA